ncbi:hypothetical protein E2C01_000287 [Portunus trituberculatus]|uniref:Uncharacterized protein n=1 Tax=Portunus trituberculatus TaxID=210409 RepID=A0A5B7CG32_PORTR|nr:hypothetical protein [Portunus trituberculatus]
MTRWSVDWWVIKTFRCRSLAANPEASHKNAKDSTSGALLKFLYSHQIFRVYHPKPVCSYPRPVLVTFIDH